MEHIPEWFFPFLLKLYFQIITNAFLLWWMNEIQTYTHFIISYFHTGTKLCINLLTLGNMFPCSSEKTYLFNMKASLGFLPQQWHYPWIKIALLFSISWNQRKHSAQSGGRWVRPIRTTADNSKHLVFVPETPEVYNDLSSVRALIHFI